MYAYEHICDLQCCVSLCKVSGRRVSGALFVFRMSIRKSLRFMEFDGAFLPFSR